MARLSPEEVWNLDKKDLLDLLDSGRLVPKPKEVHFYAPSFMHYRASYCSEPNQFPTISVTGRGCALNCKHCGGKILETMHSAETPEELLELVAELQQDGALGCLVSGGCLPNGSVPLKSFTQILKRIKHESPFTLFVHTGIVDSATAEALKNAKTDAVLIDIVGSNETIKEIYNLNVTVEDYEKSLEALYNARLNVVPHVIVGLHNGRLRGELDALRMIARYKPSALVVIAFMPIRGTAMAEVKPPSPADIARVTATARIMLPETPIALGCMRPKGKSRAETDVMALKAGVNAIAFPSEKAIRYAENQGYQLSFSPYCCAQIHLKEEH